VPFFNIKHFRQMKNLLFLTLLLLASSAYSQHEDKIQPERDGEYYYLRIYESDLDYAFSLTRKYVRSNEEVSIYIYGPDKQKMLKFGIDLGAQILQHGGIKMLFYKRRKSFIIIKFKK